MGVAIATLIVHPVSAQEFPTQTINQNYRSEIIQRNINEGLPRNYRIPQQAPSLGLGNIYGLNPCAAGVSVGVTTPVGGVGGAWSRIDDECQTRNNAAILVSGLRDEAASREVLCTIPSIRQAFIRVGRPCIADGGAAIVMPGHFPAGAGQAAQFTNAQGSQSVQGSQGVGPAGTQLPATALPPSVPRGGSLDGDPRLRSQVPSFCNTPGLDPGMYPECSGRQIAQQRGEASPPHRPVVVRSRPTAPTQSFSPATGRIGDLPSLTRGPKVAELPPALPTLGNPTNSPEGCDTVSSFVRRFYAECVAADRQAAMAAARTKAPITSGTRLAVAAQ